VELKVPASGHDTGKNTSYLHIRNQKDFVVWPLKINLIKKYIYIYIVNGLYPFGLSVFALGIGRAYADLPNHRAMRAAAFSIRAGAMRVLSHEPRRNWVGGSWTSMGYEHR